MVNIDSFDHFLNVQKLGHLLNEMGGNKHVTPHKKWSVNDAISWAVGFIKEYGLIGTDEEIMLWPDKIPDDMEFYEHQYLRFKEADWQSEMIFDWFSAYLIIRTAMQDSDDTLCYAHQYGVRFQVRAMLDLIVKQIKTNAYEKNKKLD